MTLKFNLYGVPSGDGYEKSIGSDNILMIDIRDGILWFLWDKEEVTNETIYFSFPYKFKRID